VLYEHMEVRVPRACPVVHYHSIYTASIVPSNSEIVVDTCVLYGSFCDEHRMLLG
jgi:hypothetical protein